MKTEAKTLQLANGDLLVTSSTRLPGGHLHHVTGDNTLRDSRHILQHTTSDTHYTLHKVKTMSKESDFYLHECLTARWCMPSRQSDAASSAHTHTHTQRKSRRMQTHKHKDEWRRRRRRRDVDTNLQH